MRHAIRIAIIWVIISALVILAIALIPIPSPTGSAEAEGIHQTIYMLFYVGAPIFVFVWVVLVYAIVTFRDRGPASGEVPPLPETNTLVFLWAGVTFLVVLFMAGWGTFTLHEITQPPSASAQGQSQPDAATESTASAGAERTEPKAEGWPICIASLNDPVGIDAAGRCLRS